MTFTVPPLSLSLTLCAAGVWLVWSAIDRAAAARAAAGLSFAVGLRAGVGTLLLYVSGAVSRL